MSLKMVGERLQVRIDHVAAALSKVYKSPVVDTILSLPQHQQVGYICNMVGYFRDGICYVVI